MTSCLSFKWVIYDCETRTQIELIKLVLNNFKNSSRSNLLKSSNLVWFGKAFYSSDVEMWMELKGYLNRVQEGELNRKRLLCVGYLIYFSNYFQKNLNFILDHLSCQKNRMS